MECIWCRNKSGEHSVEHIIPDAIGCPEDFVLKNGEVCKDCNNKLAVLDRAVLNEFEIHAFMAGVPRKRNRPPTISSRGNLVGKYILGEKTIFINMEKYPVKGVDGTHIAPFGKSSRNVKAKFKKEGLNAKISFQTSFSYDERFVQGIYKIAFESMAYFLGYKALLSDKYNRIREFVLFGKNERKVLVFPAQDKQYQNEVKSRYSPTQNGYMIEMRLGNVCFIVDLSPEMTIFPILFQEAKKLYGNKGWGYFPVDLKNKT